MHKARVESSQSMLIFFLVNDYDDDDDEFGSRLQIINHHCTYLQVAISISSRARTRERECKFYVQPRPQSIVCRRRTQ